ncbi:MAG: hypothetical protein ACYS74_04805 [Planctomycetota bacterium]|jgi:hypothetical protein
MNVRIKNPLDMNITGSASQNDIRSAKKFNANSENNGIRVLQSCQMLFALLDF